MIKQGVISRISFLAAGLVIFLVGFFLLLNLVIPAFLVLVLAYLALKNHETKSYTFLHLAFLFLMNFSIGYFIMMHDLPIYYIPFAVIPMLACILFNDLEIALLLSLTSSISIVSVKSDHLALSVFLFTSGLFASLLVYGARRRITLIRAGFSIGAMQMLLFFFLNSFRIGHLEPFLWFAVNGVVSSIIVVGALRIFEYLFDTMTNFTLLELADFNHPLLQRMTLEAPGTYHHSLVVGNLADAASRVVGANALLARIGAYYHDIGKLQKPHYFSENQSLSESRHDSLSATMSKLVIMNHVKEGVELAQKYKLHKNIIDFINQHHGTSLVYYFYRRALENLEGTGQQVEEEGFRYPGPRPKTKEAAIVLLADSVEAATRSLKDPDPTSVEEVVHKIINNKFIDGQLDECDLTLRNLEKIAAVFIRILSGIYHSRVTYPESQRSEDNHKKSTEESSSQRDQDPKAGA